MEHQNISRFPLLLAWSDFWEGGMWVEDQKEWLVTAKSGFYSGAKSFYRRWAKNESTSQHQRHPTNSTKKLEVLISLFRLNLRKTLVSSTLPFVPSGTSLSHCWKLTRNGTVRPLRCCNNYGTLQIYLKLILYRSQGNHTHAHTYKTKLRGLSPHANYTDRAAAAGRRS